MNAPLSASTSWRRRILMITLAVLAVMAGSVIGSGLTIITMRYSMFPRPPHPDAVATTLLERMASLFEMTEDETGRVREIIDRRMKEVKRIRQVSFDEIRGQFDGMRLELAEVLGAQRAEAWETFLRKQRQQSSWGGSPPHWGNGVSGGGPPRGDAPHGGFRGGFRSKPGAEPAVPSPPIPDATPQTESTSDE